MRQAVLFLMVLLILSGYNGFASGKKEKTINANLTINLKGIPETSTDKNEIKPNKPSDPPRMPIIPVNLGDRLTVNSEFANITERTPVNKAKYYISKTFTLRIDEQKGSSEVIIDDNGMVVMKRNESKPNEIKFTNDLEGEYNYSENNRFFDILFKPNDNQSILRFTRNSQLDNFILTSVKVNNEDHPIRNVEGEPIVLQVYGKDERNHVISAGSKITSETKKSDKDFRDIQPGDNGKTSRNTNIISSGKSNPSGIIRYIKYKNKNPALSEANIERLISLYINEAALENVNHDIAIAQMLHLTNFLGSANVKNTHNYAGLSTKGARWNGKHWNGKFNDMQQGVRAHIQHLRFYARKTKRNSWLNVDPRWNQIRNISGSIQTFDQLYPKWAPYYTESYKKSIEKILEDLYSYSSR